jgi:membrane protease YdiL (CAAX protease family)
LHPQDPRLRGALALFEATAAVTGTMLLAVVVLGVFVPGSVAVLAQLAGTPFPAGLGPAELPTPEQALARTLGLQTAVLLLTGIGLALWRCPRFFPTTGWTGRVAWGLAAGADALLLSAVVAAVQEAAGVPVHEQEPLLRVIREIPLARSLPWIAVVAPIGEEVFFRGYLFRFLAARAPLALAYAVSALAFAAIHFNPSGFLVYAGIGLVLAAAYRRTGSLLVPVLGHAVHNGLTLLAVYGS